MQQLIGFLLQLSALALLRAVVDQRDARAFDPHDLFHIDAAHDAELLQHFRTAFGVRAAVHQNRMAGVRRQQRCHRRALDALDPARDHRGTDQQRAGIAGGYKCIALAVGQRLHADCHGAVLLRLDHIGRLILHRDDLVGMEQRDAVQRDSVFGSQRLDLVLVAAEHDLNAQLLDGSCSALQRSKRGIVAAHRI